MLGHSRRQELALEVVERGFGDVHVPDPPLTDFAAHGTEEAAARADLLRAEQSRTPRWRRARRRELGELATANERAASRRLEQFEPPGETTLLTSRWTGDADPDELRVAALDPAPEIARRIGPFPARWHERESWTRAAVELAARPQFDPIPLADLPDPGPEVGLEL